MKTLEKIENRITSSFLKKEKLLNIYFTAGYPGLNDTAEIIKLLEKHGADMIEIGIPFSDSLMDGPVILKSNEIALRNGMNMDILFSQLKDIRDQVEIPLLLMGSMNTVFKYGFGHFCEKCAKTGIDGTIIPDLPLRDYTLFYKKIFTDHQISNVCMVTPQTTEERMRLIDEHTKGFIYVMSSASTTGKGKKINDSEVYLKKTKSMNLKNPLLTGFNINTKEDIDFAKQYSNGAIVGSAFIKALEEKGTLEAKIKIFMEKLIEN